VLNPAEGAEIFAGHLLDGRDFVEAVDDLVAVLARGGSLRHVWFQLSQIRSVRLSHAITSVSAALHSSGSTTPGMWSSMARYHTR
jgi:hypothetical protein